MQKEFLLCYAALLQWHCPASPAPRPRSWPNSKVLFCGDTGHVGFSFEEVLLLCGRSFGMRCPLVIAPNQPYKVAGSAARLFTWQHRAHEDRHRPTNQSRTMQMQAKSDISRTHRYAKCQAHSSLTTSVYFGTFANRSSSTSMPIRQIFVAVITREHLESNCFLSFMAQACLM